MVLLTLVVGCVVLYCIWRLNKDFYILAFFSRRVRTADGSDLEQKVPIPKGHTIFANAFDLVGLDNAGVFKYSRRLAKEMGKSYLQYAMGTPIYNIIDAEDAEIVLNDQNLITKGLIYDFLHPFVRTGLLTSTEKKWHSRRKMLTPTFHFSILSQFVEVFKTESIKFVANFEQKSESVISLNSLIPRFTLNSICETAMGVRLDDMAEKGDRYRESFNMIEECFIKRLSNPLYWNERVYELFMAARYRKHLEIVHGFSSEVIAKRRKLFEEELQLRKESQTADDDIYVTRKQRFAMLDTLLNAEKDGLIYHTGICEEVDTLMFEGFDTTSMGLIFGLMNLSLYAEEQERCYQEIQMHINDDLSKFDVESLGKLKYLECFIKETMRLYPSVPVIARQTVRETKLANGLILPSRAQITIHIFDIHRNPKYYTEPESFQPERFKPENTVDRHTYAYLPFSAGRRNCIGQKYAILEMKTLIVVILKRFKIMPFEAPKTLIFEAGITIRAKDNIKIKLVRRNQTS